MGEGSANAPALEGDQRPGSVLAQHWIVGGPGECGLYVRARIEVRLRAIDVDMRHQRGHLWTTATTKAGFGVLTLCAVWTVAEFYVFSP